METAMRVIKMLLAVGLIAATTGACAAYYGDYPSTAYYRSGYYRSGYYPTYYAYRPGYAYYPQTAYAYY
jgi:hypothetical protein